MNFSHEFWIQIIVYVVGGFVFVAINAFRVGQMEARLATKEELTLKVKERDAKIDRVYVRFDEHKRNADEHFVRRDMCGQLHSTAKEEVRKIEEDNKAFRHEIRTQVQKIFDKLDELRNMIVERPR